MHIRQGHRKFIYSDVDAEYMGDLLVCGLGRVLEVCASFILSALFFLS